MILCPGCHRVLETDAEKALGCCLRCVEARPDEVRTAGNQPSGGTVLVTLDPLLSRSARFGTHLTIDAEKPSVKPTN